MKPSSRRIKKVALVLTAILIVLLAIVAITFKGRKLIAYFTPPPEVTVSELKTEYLDNVKIYRSDQTPKGLAIIAADTWHTQERDEDAKALAEAGVIAVTFDFEAFRQKQKDTPKDEECHYVSDDMKDSGEAIQRHLGIKQYLFPLIVGIGDGASFAYAAVAQAPENTLAGGISVDFTPLLKSDRPYCPGEKMEKVTIPGETEGEYSLGNDEQLPSPWRVIAPKSNRDGIAAFQKPLEDAELTVADTPHEKRQALVSAALEMGRQGDQGIQSLPVSLIEPNGPTKAVIVIISGDGGWRDIDKSVGENLAEKGIAVVGIDALRYFWSKREPAQIAADLDLLFNHYGEKYGSRQYALAGYSFGADVIPFAWPLMAKATKDNMKLISLLGLEPDAEFEISVEGYLGTTTDEAKPVKPMLSRLPLARTQCIYGTEEVEDGDTACLLPELEGAERIAMKGGHHFDEDYDALAEKIYVRLLGNRAAASENKPDAPTASNK